MKFPRVLIVGAGPAGIAAAIQLKRYGSEPILLERWRVGGLLWNANLVENYPGFPQGIRGPRLVALFERQLRHLGIEVHVQDVVALEYHNGWSVRTFQGVYKPDIVVVASGTQSNPYPIDIPSDVQDRVFSEVWPLLDVSGKRVAVVGAGDAAFDYALNLVGRGNTVTILNRGKKLKCLSLLEERAFACPSVSYLDRTHLQQVQGEPPGGCLRLLTSSGWLEADYLLFAIGRQPRLDFLSESVKRQATKLTQDGKLYFIGDVHNGLLRQTAIAVGDGLRAAMQIYARGAQERL